MPNQARDKNILSEAVSSVSSSADQEDSIEDNISDASESEVCCICFDQLCTIEVQDCVHQMCALYALTLCCHNKPNPTSAYSPPLACPFYRRSIAHTQEEIIRGSMTKNPYSSAEIGPLMRDVKK